MSTNQKVNNHHVNFIVNYTVLKGIGGPQKRNFNLFFHNISLELKDKIEKAGIGRLVNWKPFQDEMIRWLNNNNFFVEIPKDWSNLFFKAKVQDGSYFDRDIMIDEIIFDHGYEERLKSRKLNEDLFLFN